MTFIPNDISNLTERTELGNEFQCSEKASEPDPHCSGIEHKRKYLQIECSNAIFVCTQSQFEQER